MEMGHTIYYFLVHNIVVYTLCFFARKSGVEGSKTAIRKVDFHVWKSLSFSELREEGKKGKKIVRGGFGAWNDISEKAN